MVFKLEISRNNTNFFNVDIFPNQQLDYDVDFYDTLEVNRIKLPFSSSMKIPLTTTNKSTNVFNYDPLTDTQDDFPREDFFFKITIFRSTDVTIQGILNVVSFEYLSDEPFIDVELKDFVHKYISDLKDTNISELYNSYNSSWRTSSYNPTTPLEMSDFFDPVASGGERGTVGQNPDSTRPIIFPFVDFCNDVHGKFGYGARQFPEYGSGMHRNGIIPVFSVKYFLKAIGDWLTGQGFETRVDSKLFGLNYTEHDASFEAEKLYMLIPCKLEADKDTNTRNFVLQQAPFWTGTNENLTAETDYSTGSSHDFITNYFFSNETFGNFGAHTEPNSEDPTITDPVTSTTDFGLSVTNAAYPEGPYDPTTGTGRQFGYERGYFAPFMSFNGTIDWENTQSSATLQGLKYEIPVVKRDEMVHSYDLSASTMTFGVFIGIAEQGEMVKKIRLVDANGDNIVLSASAASQVAGQSNKTDTLDDDGTGTDRRHFFSNRTYSKLVLMDEDEVGSPTDTLLFEDFEVYMPSNEDIEINGETRYGVNYFIEPVGGELKVNIGSDLQVGYAGISSVLCDAYIDTTLVTRTAADIRKAITRISSYTNMDIKITANSNFNPYFTSDVYNIKDSLENTCTNKALELLTAICKRFGCGIYYETDGSVNVLRVDPLHVIRSGSQNINDLVDDLKSAKVFLGGDKIKNLTIENKDFGLYYDDEDDDKITIGSTTQEINADGISDLSINLESSIYFKSVCGDEMEFPENANLINGIVSEKEVAFTPNLFTKNSDIGIRFAYVDKPLYRTMLRRPVVVNSSHEPDIYTVTQRIYDNWTIHTFNGRLRTINTQGFDLRATDDDGNTTDYYDLFTDNEKIKYSDSASIEFDMVLETSELSSLDFFFKTLSCTRINQSNILIKSAEGEVFEDFAYLTIKGILQ